MRIVIAERLRPFSHVPGTFCMLPGSTFRLQIFPALLRVHDLAGRTPQFIQEISFDVKGPLDDFTIQQDLEKRCVFVWGKGPKGYFRHKQEAENPYQPKFMERLSLGSHQSQDWTLVQRRLAMEQILPLWHYLGQMTPPQSAEKVGVLSLFEELDQIMQKSEERVPFLKKLYRVGFEGILSPRLEDEEHQGFDIPKVLPNAQTTTLALLSLGASLIRNLFFQVNKREISLLPLLPPEFHCGRFLGLQIPEIGSIDMEWSKKQIRRLIFHCESQTELLFHFNRDLRRFRLRRCSKERGQFLPTKTPLQFEKGDYYLDNFQK